MVDSYNDMKTSYDEYGKLENNRNKLVGVLVAQTSAILEMLVTVYPNSKNLPQGVKDRINLTYANCLKMIGDDEQLLAVVKAVRKSISATDWNETTETEG